MRTRWILSGCLVLVGIAFAWRVTWLAPVAAQPKEGSDWPSFLGPLGTSVSPEKGIVSPWPKDGPKVVWHRKVGTGYSAPVISKGKLYLFDRKGQNAILTCMKPNTGEPIWTFDYPTNYRDRFNYNGGPRCCPVVDGDHVFIHGVEGMLHCINAGTGKVVWKVDTVAEFGVVQNFFGVGSTPIVEEDLLIVHIGGSPANSKDEDFADLKGNGSGIVAFDKATGKIRWKLSDELASYASPVVTTIGDRRWGFVFARGGLVAFDPKSGKQDFHFPWRAKDFESVNAANPVVVGDKVLITETYGIGSALLKVKPGAEPDVVWQEALKPKKSLQCHWMTPIHHEGYVYGSSGRHDYNAELRCVELATGKVVWREPELTRTSLLMVDGHFVCLGEDGVLRLLRVNSQKYDEVSEALLVDPQTKAPLLRYPCWAAPVLAHGLMYLRGEDRLVCVELIPQK